MKIMKLLASCIMPELNQHLTKGLAFKDKNIDSAFL